MLFNLDNILVHFNFITLKFQRSLHIVNQFLYLYIFQDWHCFMSMYPALIINSEFHL